MICKGGKKLPYLLNLWLRSCLLLTRSYNGDRPSPLWLNGEGHILLGSDQNDLFDDILCLVAAGGGSLEGVGVSGGNN